jgi:hypothetical protein
MAITTAAVFLSPGHSDAQSGADTSSTQHFATVIEFESSAELAASGGKIVANAPAYVIFEEGISGRAARFPRDDKLYSATVQFPAGNIDVSDVDEMGKRLEFWLKFNEDPHVFSGNKFLISVYPVFMVEIYGTKPFLAFEFYGNGDNDGTNGRFLTYTQGWDRWEKWKVGQWHKITLSWKRNGREGNAEMHLYIDDSQEGCLPERCNDYRGILPTKATLNKFVVGNPSKKAAIDFSIDQMRILSSWP